MNLGRRQLLITATLAITCSAASPARARPSFYVSIRSVEQTDDGKCKLQEPARDLLDKSLSKHPSVVTRLRDPEPTGKALEAELKARKLTGYAVILRITRCAHRLMPPRPGHAYKILAVEVRTAIDAERLPSSKMAAAGDGMAEVATEVNRIKESELKSLRIEALGAAIGQAAGKFVAGLSQPERKRRAKGGRRKSR